MTQCYKCFVSGRVQGVYYRGSTQNQAQDLGVTGYAKNLSDGRVEVLMCGQADAIESLKNWLYTGPQFAEVRGVHCERIDLEQHEIPQRFSTG